MVSNDQVILDRLLAQRRQQVASSMSEPSYFGLFAVEQVLKRFEVEELSYDELEAGIVDGGGDGGIDALYAFVNGRLLSDELDVSGLRKPIKLDLIIIQAKTSNGYSEAAVSKLHDTSRDLLDLGRDLNDFRGTYNSSLLGLLESFHRTYLDLTSKFPEFCISYFYVSRGAEVHPNVWRKVEDLKATIRRMHSKAFVNFEFLGARDLLSLAGQLPTTSFPLGVAETITTEQDGYICLVRLKDYFAFITTDDGKLRSHLFDANVRDYTGPTKVNEEIRSTLENPGDEDFWWLNNGITIVTSEAGLAGKKLTIRDAQVVNGLQTSREIYNYFSSRSDATDDRKILVRVIVAHNDASRDRVIKATNSQNRISVASLRATEQIHRDLETYFSTHDFFYDRRKNYYKNAGRPKDKIISIQYLAQAMAAIVLRRPDDSRGRPSSLLERDEDYEKLFNPSYSPDLYLNCASFMKFLDQYLKEMTQLPAKDRNNMKYHLAMFVTIFMTSKLDYTPSDVLAVDWSSVGYDLLEAMAEDVMKIYFRLQEERNLSGDQVAKSPLFVNELRSFLDDTVPDER